MSKRVFVGGLHHESDTFNPITTSEKDIRVLRGQELLASRGTAAVNGIIETLTKAGYEIIPGLVARAVPNGEWDKTYALGLMDELLNMLRAALPVDAVCLSLHGSMRIRDFGESEGPLLKEVRRLCPDVPIVASLDMHATVTSDMLKYADALVGYKTAPHTDEYETGAHAAGIVIKSLEQGARPRMAAIRLPFLLAGEQSETSAQPMKDMISLLRECEKRPGILAASYLLGFPWADVAENGVAALAVSDNDDKSARDEALKLAHAFWDKRKDFRFAADALEIPEAIESAVSSIHDGAWPVVLSDSGDNPTAGSSQDVTSFLRAIIDDGRLTHLDPPLCYQGIYDPAFCEAAFRAGEGNKVSGPLGAAFDKKTSRPINMDGTVIALHKAWEGAGHTDLALVRFSGVDIVVTSGHVGCYDPEMMRALGAEPRERKAIVVKLGYLEPEIRSIAKRSILVLSDGSTNEVFDRLPYRNLTRPIFPLDADAVCTFDFI